MEQVTLKYKDQHYPYESYVNTQLRLHNIAQVDLVNADY